MSTFINVSSKLAPSFSMVSRYFIASVISFLLFTLLLLINYYDIHGHHFQPKLLALTHIATLGWVSMIIFGVMYQLIPVVLGVKLYSERLGEIQFWVYSVGIIGLVYGFWAFSVGMHLTMSAALLTAAIFIFIFNVIRTMMSVTNWNITGLFILTSLVYLALTAVSGLILAYNLGFPFIGRIHLDYLIIHAHFGFIGWVMMVIMGVGLKLIPMFGLSHNFSLLPAKISYVTINIGLIGTSVEWTFTGPGWLLNVYLILLISGLLSYLCQIFLIMKHRVRKILDIGMKHSAAAFAYCAIAVSVGAILHFFHPAGLEIQESTVLLYGFIIIVGFFSSLIVGQMYKIVPFLVWFHTYSNRAGKEPVPLLKDMLNERIAAFQFWILNFAVIIGSAGTLLSIPQVQLVGFSLLATAALLFTYNIGSVFLIWRKDGRKNS